MVQVLQVQGQEAGEARHWGQHIVVHQTVPGQVEMDLRATVILLPRY